MGEESDSVTPPEGLPDRIASELGRLTDTELRKTILYAQERLRTHGEQELPVEPREEESIIKLTEQNTTGTPKSSRQPPVRRAVMTVHTALTCTT